MRSIPPDSIRHRGALSNPDNRYDALRRDDVDDGWYTADEQLPPLATTLAIDHSRSIISYNQSPDVPFDRSINPYRGCEHGCVYCFARPSHAWLGLSPGLDFETQLFYKPDAVRLLRNELAARNYRCAPLALGINTDAYQPVEHRLGLTRQLLEVLVETRHPVTIVTKSALIERDIDLLSELARHRLVQVALSVTTLDHALSRNLEPRSAVPRRRLQTIRTLQAAGIPVSVLIAPLIPFLNDHELEHILEQVHQAGALQAGYVMLRLPHELKDLFREWLQRHVPLKAAHIMNRIADLHDGKTYDARFGQRMRGSGPYADLIAQRYRRAMQRLGFNGLPALDCTQFTPPRDPHNTQIEMFDSR
ncbi:MAG: PA0069 family radical SAM protein [Gammaproteobacteria bacterium]|nr:PA0069 family radical SAM protein [Gammaproteobacteria bacterium]